MGAVVKKVEMATFNVYDVLDDDGVPQVADMFPLPDTTALTDYVEIDLDADFNYQLKSVHTYVVLFHSPSQVSLSIKPKLTEWNDLHEVKVIRYQVLADACATDFSNVRCSLAVTNARLDITEKVGGSVNPEGETSVTSLFSLDNTKTPADMMVGDEILRQIKYHQNHPVRISDKIDIGDTYGACALIQFTDIVDEGEFQSFMETPHGSLPGYSVPAADAGGNGRVFVGFMKEDTETDFQNIIDANYDVSVRGYCVLEVKEEEEEG